MDLMKVLFECQWLLDLPLYLTILRRFYTKSTEIYLKNSSDVSVKKNALIRSFFPVDFHSRGKKDWETLDKIAKFWRLLFVVSSAIVMFWNVSHRCLWKWFWLLWNFYNFYNFAMKNEISFKEWRKKKNTFQHLVIPSRSINMKGFEWNFRELEAFKHFSFNCIHHITFPQLRTFHQIIWNLSHL